jgi:hypothetical protein
MNDTAARRRAHDLTYACFLPLGLVGLVSGVASLLPLDSGTAGGIGLLLLVPLALMSMVTAPIGVYRTLGFRHDAALWTLSLITVLMVVQLFAELGPVQVQNLVWLGYGVLVFLLQASWFLVRRRRAYPG